MSVAFALMIVFAAGCVGGAVNALLSDNGFVLPRPETTSGMRIVRPGFLGNMLVGGVAAAISWGLYGPFAASFIAGGPVPLPGAPAIGVTLSALVGAALIGVAGARWLSNEVDKRLLRAAGAEASKAAPSDDMKNVFWSDNPAAILDAVSHSD